MISQYELTHIYSVKGNNYYMMLTWYIECYFRKLKLSYKSSKIIYKFSWIVWIQIVLLLNWNVLKVRIWLYTTQVRISETTLKVFSVVNGNILLDILKMIFIGLFEIFKKVLLVTHKLETASNNTIMKGTPSAIPILNYKFGRFWHYIYFLKICGVSFDFPTKKDNKSYGTETKDV